MNDRYLLSVKIIQSLENFVTPFLNNFQFWITNLFQILPQTTPCNHLSNKMNLLSFLSYPSTDECYNVGMIELFDQRNLWFNSRALWLRQVANINKTPSNFSASIVIKTSINTFIGTSPSSSENLLNLPVGETNTTFYSAVSSSSFSSSVGKRPPSLLLLSSCTSLLSSSFNWLSMVSITSGTWT